MKTLEFVKMHGCGNDYIYFDCMDGKNIDPHEMELFWLCDRNKGIGGDGLVFILPSDAADARMQMFNIDGSEGMMCGNAIRCVAEYLYSKNLAPSSMKIETPSGIKTIKAADSRPNWVVDMGQAKFLPSEINASLVVDVEEYRITQVNMGNPHAVVFMDEIDKLDLVATGTKFEHHEKFQPERTNTEFVQVLSKNHLKMRVWERGSGETQACGTGACAAAVAAVLNGYCNKNEDIVVSLLGGDLTIKYTDEAVFMTGEAVKVFEGAVEV
ncbi:MAG: diaminopimelate epimerase [Defluviitaleaceae bacterium]|nr:diaminopimelate epimerase [Defluviitaleaceae bacterium]